jgi:hypothetical protein
MRAKASTPSETQLVTTQISENGENVVTFTKQSPNKKDPPGRRIYPAE